MMRSKNLDQKNNSGFNILTGEDRSGIKVPYHEKYNPIHSSHSQVSQIPKSSASQVSKGGILPGMSWIT